MSERTDLLERYAAEGRTLGARPGVAILSFWQGALEIVYRIVALVSSNALMPFPELLPANVNLRMHRCS